MFNTIANDRRNALSAQVYLTQGVSESNPAFISRFTSLSSDAYRPDLRFSLRNPYGSSDSIGSSDSTVVEQYRAYPAASRPYNDVCHNEQHREMPVPIIAPSAAHHYATESGNKVKKSFCQQISSALIRCFIPCIKNNK